LINGVSTAAVCEELGSSFTFHLDLLYYEEILFGQMRLTCLVIGYEMNAHCISDISLVVFAYGMDRVTLMLVLLYASRFVFIFSTNKSLNQSAHVPQKEKPFKFPRRTFIME